MEWKRYPVVRELEISEFVTAIEKFHERAYEFEGEMHDFWEIITVTSGRATVSADDRIYEMKPGSVVFHKPMEFHKIWASGDSAIHVHIISFKASGEYMKRFRNVYMEFTEAQSFEFGEIVRGVAQYLDESLEDSVVPEEEAKRLELFLLRLYPKKMPIEVKSQKNRRFMQILQVMHDHFDEDLTLEDLARLCSMSPSNLKKIFTAFYPNGIMNYFRMLKMREAAKLLRRGYSVHEVSQKLNFSSQNYFSAAFRREFGMPPSVYIKENTKSTS